MHNFLLPQHLRTYKQARGVALFFSRRLLLYSSWQLHIFPKREVSYVSTALCQRITPSRHKVLAPEVCAWPNCLPKLAWSKYLPPVQSAWRWRRNRQSYVTIPPLQRFQHTHHAGGKYTQVYERQKKIHRIFYSYLSSFEWDLIIHGYVSCVYLHMLCFRCSCKTSIGFLN